jgi:hypothetical protein
MVLLLPLLLHIQGDQAQLALAEALQRIATLEGTVEVLTQEKLAHIENNMTTDLHYAQVL